jgi:mannosylglycerate hydrolase
VSRKVAVVAHTHWDREWHLPFEVFQLRLVAMMEDLLGVLDRHPDFEQFLLDGQMAVMDDFLALRPDARPKVADLAQAGRLAMGPWYVLMDEFCVSAETIVRNLQLGWSKAAALGSAQPVGYLPDMFGHVGQMPQILAQAGLRHAVVWRGVPAAVDRTGFSWSAPDGSTVRAEYLPVGYANGAVLPRDPEALLRRIEAHEAEVARFLGDPSQPLLLMNGGDQHGPQPHMPALLDAANRQQDRYEFTQLSLGEHLCSLPGEGLPAWCGELRSGARANLLMGVASNRVDIKVAAAVAERTIEQLAEPLAALWLPPELWPGELLDRAWLEMIRNSAHDSICACSADEVGRAVKHRYDQATALAADVVGRALAIAGVATNRSGPVVVNPSARRRAGVVELDWPGADLPSGAQLLAATAAATEERTGCGADLAEILGGLARDGWLGPDGRCDDLQIDARADGLVLTVRQDAARRASPQVAATMAEAWAQAGARAAQPLRMVVHRAASQRIAVRAGPVPGYGWSVWEPAGLGVDPVRAAPAWLDNGLTRIEVDPKTGTFSLDGLTGLDRLIEGGDEGDTYNYSPPAVDTLVDRPEQVAVELLEPGPVRGVLRVRRRYRWPQRVAGGQRIGIETVEVMTDVEVRAGERLVRMVTTLDNRCRDHRLRATFPLPAPVDRSVAECAFATVERGAPEAGRHEVALATYPSRRFVRAGALTVTHEGLLEYELIDGGRALALTLLRATGVLSRPAPAYRPNAAGPPLALTDAQLLGPHRVRYAIAVGDDDPYSLADQAWNPMLVAAASGAGKLPGSGNRLTVEGAEVSSLRRQEGRLEVRVFNPSDRTVTVRIPGHEGWLVDLLGRELERWRQHFPLRPWGIATARLDAVSLDG